MTAPGDTTLDAILTILVDVCRDIPGIRTATADPPSTLSGPQLPMMVPFPVTSRRSRSVGTVNWIHSTELVVFVTPQAGNYPRELPLVRKLIEVIPQAIERAWLSRTVFGTRVRSIETSEETPITFGVRSYGQNADGTPVNYHCITYTLEIQVRETPGEMTP